MLNQFAMNIEIHSAPQKIFDFAGFAITNSLLTGLVSSIILVGVGLYVANSVKKGKYNRFIGLAQWSFEGMLGQVYSVIPDPKLAKKVAPLALTIFFTMLFSYWMSILPGLDSVKYDGNSLLRALTADLNFTTAVALIVFVTVQFYAIKAHGNVGNMKRYLRNPLKDPIGSFEGLLELIGEASRYIALSVRMFGNCFAGEILLVIISLLTSYAAAVTLPFFMAFELFIGFIQAYVFFILTVIFTSLAVESHGVHDDDKNITSVDHSSAKSTAHSAA